MKMIPLTQGKFALVDDEDYQRLNKYKWSAWTRKGYSTWYALRKTSMNGKQTTIYMHREILKPPIGMETDHKNGDGLNNQRHNLRIATRAQNMHNRKKQTGISQFKGVHWRQLRNEWCAQIMVKNQHIFLGYFLSETEAAQAYDAAAIKYFGEFAHTNFGRKVS